MASAASQSQLLKLAISVIIDLPNYAHAPGLDLLIEVQAQATVQDLVDAIVSHKDIEPNPDYGLIRTLVRTRDAAVDNSAFYLPPEVALADCGLLDGVILELADRSQRPVPTLRIDIEQANDDLFLIDERGTRRGRITRLPADEPMLLGTNPPGDHQILADDVAVGAHAVTLINRGGNYVQCVPVNRANLYLSGTPASDQQAQLLPGTTISFRRDDVECVSFVITTRAALHGRSPVGRVQFDVTARLEDPKYQPLPERMAKIPAQPSLPERQPFPFEQVLIPLGIVLALYLATRSILSLIASPLAAVFPIVSQFRQRKQARLRYNKERAVWVASLEKTGKELTDLAGVEEKNLRSESPPPEVWALRAYRRLAGLWGRDPERADFLRVRLGLGQLPSRYQSRLDTGLDGEDPDFVRVMEVKGRQIGPDVVQPVLFDAPFTVDLRAYQLGLVGPLKIVDDVATDVLVQVACAHPPGTVSIAALLPASDIARQRYDWLKWLPHTRAGSALLPSERIVAGREACDAFLTAMQALHQERKAHRADERPESFALLVVHEAAEVDIATLTEVCNLADDLVRVLWLGGSKDTAPQLVTSLVEVVEDREDGQDSTGKLLSGDPALVKREFALNLFQVNPINTVHALAGLYDPRSSGANAGIPQSAPLSAVTDLSDIRYSSRPELSIARSLPVPIGVGESGILELDLIKHGPHVLVGGTTGAGKSELLQTLTCGIVSRYSPDEISLFLVDFKGGATFAPFKDLPHVVGYVTDLDQRNVNRALNFLRAELRRRERCFEEMDNAKEYEDYLRQALEASREDILPRLVVVFDEFATIVQDFARETIEAVIDIARRGRSWGVHLVLATQQPSRDVVVPQVRANVNARIALRTLSPDESQTIIDRPDAAHIPHDMPGRALMSLGSNRLVEFQTAHSGAPFVPQGEQSPVVIERFDIMQAASSSTARHGSEGGEPAQRRMTQLQALVGNVRLVNRRGSYGAQVMPEALEEEPSRYRPLDKEIGSGPIKLSVGARDLPHQQRQDRLETDLSRGGLCLVGPNRSGLTTGLVTAAEAFADRTLPGMPSGLICFDAGDQLSSELRSRFEHVTCIPIARLDDVTRCIDQLWLRMRSRMTRATSPDQTDTEQVREKPILLLIDGFDVLMRSFVSSKLALWASRVTEVLTLGRGYGIYSSISVRRLRDLDTSTLASQATTVVLHGQYEGLSTPQEQRLPGFGIDSEGNLVQLFLPRDPGTDEAKPRFDEELAAFFAPEEWRRTPLARPTSDELSVALGTDELYHRTFTVSLSETHILIIGGPRSGRTKLLLTLANQLAEQAEAPVAYFSPRGLPGDRLPSSLAAITASELHRIYGSPGNRASYLAGLGSARLKDGRTLLLVDDCYAIEAMENGNTINAALSSLYRESLVQVIVATAANWIGGSPLTVSLKTSGITAYLKPTADLSEFDSGQRVRGQPLRHRPGMVYAKNDAIIQTDEAQFLVHMLEASGGETR